MAMRQEAQPPRRHSEHAHPLVLYPRGGWICDGCRDHNPAGDRMRCADGCDYDLCARCFASGAEPLAAPVCILYITSFIHSFIHSLKSIFIPFEHRHVEINYPCLSVVLLALSMRKLTDDVI
jgi:hypothetical protein